MRCVHCGGKADPDVGGRPKCKVCTVVRVIGFVVIVGVIVLNAVVRCS